MKIAQFRDEVGIRLGVIEDKEVLIPSDFKGDMAALMECGEKMGTEGEPLPLNQIDLAPPVSRPSKIIALGLNYRDHAKESKGDLPEVPLVFSKFPNSLIGSGDSINWDIGVTNKVDFEAELAVVIGKKTYKCPEEEALGAVFGYTCANDVSARDLQFGDGQWVRGKSLDTFCPLGPWIATSDEIPDPQDLDIVCRVNGRVMQESNTRLMIFGVASLIAFLSRHFTLYPGDVILTGTPSGVGAFREPSLYLKEGDHVEVEIEGIGRLSNICKTR